MIAAERPRARGWPTSSRSAWTSAAPRGWRGRREDAAAGAWFARQRGARSGCAWSATRPATVGAARRAGPWWGVGSHLDSVRARRALRRRARRVRRASRSPSTAPVAVIAFADEEGARFNTPTFGSRALAGIARRPDVLDAPRRRRRVAGRRDAPPPASIPAASRDAPAWLARLRGFLELHIDQTPRPRRAGPPSGRRALAARMRARRSSCTAAPITPARRRRARAPRRAGRRRAADRRRRRARRTATCVVTASRMLVEPNALTTIPSHVRLWLDARAPERPRRRSTAWRRRLPDGAELDRSPRARTASPFDPRVRAALGRSRERRRVLRRPRRGHPGREAARGDGARPQPHRRQPLAGGGGRPRRRRRGARPRSLAALG